MAKSFRPSTRESSIISKIESSKEYARKKALGSILDHIEELSNAVAMKLIEKELVETTSKNTLQDQINLCLVKLSRLDDFEVDYKIAPFRNLVPRPHVISIYLTAFVIEQLINHKDIVDIYGSDEEIYNTINQQVVKVLPQ